MTVKQTLHRYARLLLVQLRTSLTLAVQYRFDFFLEGVLALLWLGITLVPLMVVFAQRTTVAGWSYPEALVVVGLFSVLKAVLDGAITPSLNHVVDGIRKGTLDFILLKPADAQFLVSTARFDPWRDGPSFSGCPSSRRSSRSHPRPRRGGRRPGRVRSGRRSRR